MTIPMLPTTALDGCARSLRKVCAFHSDLASSSVSRSPEHSFSAGAGSDTFLPGAAGWLADHYRFLEAQIAETREALPRRVYLALARAGSCAAGLPRVHAMARDLVSRHADRTIAGESQETPLLESSMIRAHFTGAQSDGALSLAELWAIKPLLKLSLLETLESAMVDDARSTACETVVRTAVTNLYTLDELPWRELVESLSSLDGVLRLDPAGVYGRMDFETRDEYRRAAERISRRSRVPEEHVGRLAVDLACAGSPGGVDCEQTDHVGYYLVGPGVELLEQRAGYRAAAFLRCRRAVARWAHLVYPGSIALTTLAIVMGLAGWLRPEPLWLLVLLIVPASQAAVAIVNGVVHACIAPRRLPRLDCSDGVPDDCRTFVVVPTLLLSRANVETLVEKLEIHYLANRDPNLLFALLTDGPDAGTRGTDEDHLAEICRQEIDALNRRYAGDGCRPFYLFHRGRRWNEGESVWMAHERKRGKLNDFNRFLLGGPDAFEIKGGDLSAIGHIRYVITLDTDTQLPLDAARNLIGTAAHPLNRPVVDLRTNTITQGYAVLQPRIGISLGSAERSRFAGLQSGAVGIDSYTTAVSDVYQDVYGQGSFTGKGLYDLRAFHRAVGERFPDNSLLSHDLIEGEHARVGLVTQLELVDDYPGSYEAYSKRKHRWIRGDWQLLPWLFARVPHGRGAPIANPLSLVSRWKIFDNLRRSAIELSALAMLACGWTQDRAIAYLVATVGLLNAGPYLDLFISIVRLPPRRLLRSFARTRLAQFGNSHLEALASLVFLLHQALVTADAIVRTLVRRYVTGRHLLEWESMAQADSAPGGLSLVRWYLFLTPVASCALLVGLKQSGYAAGVVPLFLSAVWMASPWFASWMDRRPARAEAWSRSDLEFLRDVALRTWRYFLDWSRPDTHWIAPDNVDDASGHVAYRTSPTNAGLQLGATLAAHDFGYLTHQELARSFARVLDTLESLERYRGHFYNWYDIRALQPLHPRYVSSVDSGNLCASLLTMNHGCLDVLKQPIVSRALRAGLRDHCVRLREALPKTMLDQSPFRAIAKILGDGFRSTELKAWWRALDEIRPLAIELTERLARGGAETPRPRQEPAEAQYWAAAFVDRIDAAQGELRRFVPFIETPLSRGDEGEPVAGRLRELDEAAVRAPALGEMENHCDGLERSVRHCLSCAETMSPGTVESLVRFLGQIATARDAARELVADLQGVAARASSIARGADFTFLFDDRRKLLRVGYTVDSGELDPYCYGLLASEARTAVFLAIAKHDIPREAWFHLGRKLTACQDSRALLSWSGSMFEYAMPAIFMKSYDNTLIGASLRRAVRVQQLYARERRVPWGISEAAYSGSDGTHERRYQAFGVPGLAMKRMQPSDLVVAPYATLLALMIDAPAAIDNLRAMALKRWVGRYGFFESIDYRGPASGVTAQPRIVPLFMAHHLGMSLMALDNAVFDGAMQKRFHSERLVLAAELLLQERLPKLIPAGETELPAGLPGIHLQVANPPAREIAPMTGGAVMPVMARSSAVNVNLFCDQPGGEAR